MRCRKINENILQWNLSIFMPTLPKFRKFLREQLVTQPQADRLQLLRLKLSALGSFCQEIGLRFKLIFIFHDGLG